MSIILIYFAVVFAFIAVFVSPLTLQPNLRVHFGWLAIAFYLLSLVVGAR